MKILIALIAVAVLVGAAPRSSGYVIIHFATSFEQKADATETVTPMKDPDGHWRVSGYYIR